MTNKGSLSNVKVGGQVFGGESQDLDFSALSTLPYGVSLVNCFQAQRQIHCSHQFEEPFGTSNVPLEDPSDAWENPNSDGELEGERAPRLALEEV